nr:early nodulin-20 [Tanacetum cinerariifolium]
MELNVMMLFIFMALFMVQFAHSATLVVDGVSEWKNPIVQVGDSIVFRHKYNYNLYIFKNRRAFNLCNFTESTLLTPSSPTFTWHPSRLGSFYFAFKNASTEACDDDHKLAIQVSSSPTPENPVSPPLPQPTMPPAPSPSISTGVSPPLPQPTMPPAPSPSISTGGHGSIVSSSPPLPSIPGGGGVGDIVSSSPSYPWPNTPQELTSPSPSPMNAIFPSNGPLGAPRRGGSSLPFINSNPAVPLPTGEVDSATIKPMPTSSVIRLQVTLHLKFIYFARGGDTGFSGVSDEETCMASLWSSSQASVEAFLNAK